MIPVAPSISVRPLTAPDYPAVAELVSALIASAPYSRSLDAAKFAAEVCADERACDLSRQLAAPAVAGRVAALGSWRAFCTLPSGATATAWTCRSTIRSAWCAF